MDLDLKDRSVIITGGASNIGKAIVLAFAREGCRIAIADIDEAGAEKTASEARALGAPEVMSVRCDVARSDDVDAMVAAAIARFGNIDVLVNNVGWVFDRPFLSKPREEWEKEVNINFWGVLNFIRAALPHMIERKYGRIITVASDAGRIGQAREVVYSGAKAGAIGLTKALVREVGAKGITFNCVCPGMTPPPAGEAVSAHSLWKDLGDVLTPEWMERAKGAYPLGRVGTGLDIANAVVFLGSQAASFVTGQTLSVSGGYTTA